MAHEFIYSRNAVYEALRTDRRQAFTLLLAEGAQEKGRVAGQSGVELLVEGVGVVKVVANFGALLLRSAAVEDDGAGGAGLHVAPPSASAMIRVEL